MMACMFVCILLGATGILFPAQMAGVAGRFSHRFTGRLCGLFLMFVGAEMFVRSKAISLGFMVRYGGVAAFIAGGVFLLLPVAWVILTENLRDSRPLTRRVAGLILLGFACLFYAASKAAPL
jgi:hypothetical protein